MATIENAVAPSEYTETTRRLFILSQAKETYEDPVYGTLRTTSRSGGSEVTEANIARYREMLEYERVLDEANGGLMETMLVIETVTTTTNRTYEVI